jgi:hypothetical protein
MALIEHAIASKTAPAARVLPTSLTRGGGQGAEMLRGGRRWIAVSGGVLINSLILAALVLVEGTAPVVEDPTVIVVDLERFERQKPRSLPPSARAASRSAAPAKETPSAAPDGATGPITGARATGSPEIEPAWTVDPKAVEQWRLTEGNPDFGWGRYYRACKGFSNEHMTPEEKQRCHGGVPRPPSAFIGPIDGREVWRREPKFENKQTRRQERCRAYRSVRTQPGADPPPMPSLREGGCF